MEKNKLRDAAIGVGDITFQLLTSCQEKEERFAKRLQISRPEFRCLRCFRSDRQLNIKEIIERMHLSGSRLTRILDELERKGYIIRAFDPKDRRSSTVTLTNKGLELVQKIEKNYIEIHEEILKGVPEEMHEPLIKGMIRLASSLNSWLKKS